MNLAFDYHPSSVNIVNNGHTMEAVYDPGSFFTVDGTQYALKQFHFHAHSEHTVDGQSAAMEMHLVHESADGSKAVVGILINQGPEGSNTLADVTMIHPIELSPQQIAAFTPSAYVRKSVANNLNDIAKDHPALVLDVLARWQADGDANRQWLVRHALRTLVKAGDPRALALLGFEGGALSTIAAVTFTVLPPVAGPGDSVMLQLVLHNAGAAAQALVVDYRVAFPSTSSRGSSKVFKWTSCTLGQGASITLQKRHVLRPTTTRPLRRGIHTIGVQVNGLILAQAAFELKEGA